MKKQHKNIIVLILAFMLSIENFSFVRAEEKQTATNSTTTSEMLNVQAEESIISKEVSNDETDEWDEPFSEESGNFTSSIGFTNSNTTIWAVEGNDSNETIDSLLTDEAAAEFDRNIDKMYESSCINFADASVILKNSDGFRLNGGLNTDALLSANPYLTSIGLIDAESMIDTNLDQSDTSKAVYVIADSTTNGLEASAYIYVVDKDSVCIVVTDEQGMGIGNALVTISYMSNGNRVTKSMRTTNGNVKGVAAFDEMDNINYCLLDIAADGYESLTLLDETLNAGEKRTFSLKKRDADSVYVRGLDINGKDMICSDTDLVLVSENFPTEEITFSILVTATGNKSLPETVELYSNSRKKVIATFKNASKYTIGDENTAMFTLDSKWMNQNISPLAEGDELIVRYADKEYEMKNVTVENAVRDPGADSNVSMPILSAFTSFDGDTFDKKENTGSFASIAKSSGMLNGSYKIGPANVTIGWYPDGGFYILTAVDIKKLSKDWGDIFEDTWDPKDRSDLCNVMQKFKQDFWDYVLNSVKNNDELNPDVDDEGIIRDMTASYGGIKSQFSVFIAGKYNKKTELWEGSVAGAFSVKWFGGRYTYYLIPVGTIVVPAYAGIEGGITGRGTIELQLAWENALSFDNVQTTPQGFASLRIDIMPYLTGYFGLGIKGIMSGQLDLSATMDAGFKWEPFSHDDQEPFRGFLNVIFKAAVKANFLLFSVGYTLASSDWIRLIGDVEPPLFSSGTEGSEGSGDTKTYRIDLNASEEKSTLVSEGSEQQDGTFELASYIEDQVLLSDSNLDLSNNGDITLVSDNTYANGQIQMVSTVNKTLLFRIITEGGKTKLVYHHIYGDGKIDNKYYEVYSPSGCNIVEYSVVQNKANINAEIYEEQYKDYVYIAMVCTDASKDTIEGQLESSFVEGVVLDVGKNKEYCRHRFYDTKEEGKLYYYYSPMPAGNRSTMTVAFKRCEVTVKDDGSIQANLDESENIMFGLRNGMLGDFFECSLGTGDLYSDGAWYNINDPVFWAVKESGTEDCVQLRARTVTGAICDANGNNYDVTLQKPEGYEFAEGERFISHWEMMNNMIYIISCGNLYYLDNGSGKYEFTQVVTKDALQNQNSIYQFFMSGDQKLLYIAAMKSSVDRNGVINGSKLLVYTVYTTNGITERFANIHGPLEIDFEGIQPNNFTISYVSDEAGTDNDKGFALAFQVDNDVYLTSSDTIAETTDLYFWNQKSYDGLIVKDVKIQNNVVSKADKYVTATVTFQNAGCRVAGPVRFLVQSVRTNEEGIKEVETLQQIEYYIPIGQWIEIKENEGHYYKDLFAGDVLTASIGFVPSQNWKANEEYEIVVSIDPNYNYRNDPSCPVKDKDYEYSAYSGNRLSASASADIANNQLYLSGKMNIVNDEHVIELTVENRSYFMANDPSIIIVPDYDNKWSNEDKSLISSPTLLKSTSLGSQGVVDSNDEGEGAVAQSYNKSISVESLLKSGAENGLQGFYVYLVDDEGNQINSTGLHFDNPYYEAVKSSEDTTPEEETTPDPEKPSSGNEDKPASDDDHSSDNNPSKDNDDGSDTGNDPTNPDGSNDHAIGLEVFWEDENGKELKKLSFTEKGAKDILVLRFSKDPSPYIQGIYLNEDELVISQETVEVNGKQMAVVYLTTDPSTQIGYYDNETNRLVFSLDFFNSLEAKEHQLKVKYQDTSIEDETFEVTISPIAVDPTVTPQKEFKMVYLIAGVVIVLGIVLFWVSKRKREE